MSANQRETLAYAAPPKLTVFAMVGVHVSRPAVWIQAGF